VDVLVKGRGIAVTDQLRRTAEHKLSKLVRLEPRAISAEIELSAVRGARPDGVKCLDAVLQTPRRTYRARAEGPEVDVLLEQVTSRLERQVRDHRGKRRRRPAGRGDRLQSAPVSPEAAPEE
jgi:ribosomal subunit interface protein